MPQSIRKEINCLNPAGSHTMSYQLWSPSPHTQQDENTQAPIFCVHGLTRNSNDFNDLAQVMSQQRQVICPDIIGRGQSEWVAHAHLYDYSQYVSDVAALINHANKHTSHNHVDFIGTSMGGLIGMMLAAIPNTPIARLVINDVGPFLEASALDRIATYTGTAPAFTTLQEAETYLRKIHAPFAPMTDKNWQEMAKHGTKQTSDGLYHLNYDPKIGDTLRAGLTGTDINLWPLWNMIQCPTLVIRGEHSDLLSKATAQQMTTTGPKAKLIEIETAGHAPSLMSMDQIDLIKTWLTDTKIKKI